MKKSFASMHIISYHVICIQDQRGFLVFNYLPLWSYKQCLSSYFSDWRYLDKGNYHTPILTMNRQIDTYITTFASLHIITCISCCIMPKISVEINFRIYRQTDWINFQICIKSAGEKFPIRACKHQLYYSTFHVV